MMSDNVSYVMKWCSFRSRLAYLPTYHVRMPPNTNPPNPTPTLRCGMIGFGMIFDDTYRPVFETRAGEPLFTLETGPVGIRLTAVATRTGSRSARYLATEAGQRFPFANFAGPNAVE